jgi:hypothetical protein
MRYPSDSFQMEGSLWNNGPGSDMYGHVNNYTPAVVHEQSTVFEEVGNSDSDVGNSEQADCGEKLGPARRGPFRSLYDRAQTAQTRKDTACLRCRMQRIRVFITQSNVYHQLIYVSVYSRPCRSKGSLFDLPESHKREDCEVAMSSLEDYRNQTIQARASSRIRMDSTMARFEIG